VIPRLCRDRPADGFTNDLTVCNRCVVVVTPASPAHAYTYASLPLGASRLHDFSAEITAVDILNIHCIILKNIDEHNAEKYRSVRGRLSDSQTILPNPLKVPESWMILFNDFQIQTLTLNIPQSWPLTSSVNYWPP
jgi:hypothetical protein